MMILVAILVGMAAVITGLVINSIHLENVAIKEFEKRKAQGWNWN